VQRHGNRLFLFLFISYAKAHDVLAYWLLFGLFRLRVHWNSNMAVNSFVGIGLWFAAHFFANFKR